MDRPDALRAVHAVAAVIWIFWRIQVAQDDLLAEFPLNKTAPCMETNRQRPPWLWVPSLYLLAGHSIRHRHDDVGDHVHKRLGLSNTDIALYTSSLNLPWVLKPLWSPIIDLKRTKSDSGW